MLHFHGSTRISMKKYSRKIYTNFYVEGIAVGLITEENNGTLLNLTLRKLYEMKKKIVYGCIIMTIIKNEKVWWCNGRIIEVEFSHCQQ